MKKKLLHISLIFVFSLILWGFISLSNEYNANIKSEIRITNLPKGYEVASISTKYINLRVKGQGWEIAKYFWGPDLSYDVELADSGYKTLNLRDYVEANMPSTITVDKIYPEIIDCRIEKIFTKKVPIKPNIKVKTLDGYGVVSTIKLVPDSVIVSGAKSVVSTLDYIPTIVKELDNVDKDLSDEIALNKFENLEYNLDKVNFSFKVQKIVDKTISGIVVETRKVPGLLSLQTFPGIVDIVLRGGIDHLANITGKDIKVYVEFKQALEDTIGAIKPKVIFPENTKLIKVIPPRLQYSIKKF